MKTTTRTSMPTTSATARQHKNWGLIDRLAKTAGSSAVLTFNGATVDAGWYHPGLASTLCGLCGRKCRERGEPPCANLNPLCG